MIDLNKCSFQLEQVKELLPTGASEKHHSELIDRKDVIFNQDITFLYTFRFPFLLVFILLLYCKLRTYQEVNTIEWTFHNLAFL